MSQGESEISASYIGFEREVLHDNIALCDQKSGMLMALSSVLVIFCLQSLPVPPDIRHALGSALSLLMNVLYGVGILGFTTAAYLALRVVAPRVRGRTDDHIFWMSGLFDLPAEQFLARLHAAGPAQLEREMALHLSTLAQICRAKYALFARAQFVGELSFLAVVLAEAIRVFG